VSTEFATLDSIAENVSGVLGVVGWCSRRDDSSVKELRGREKGA
jgi:hypothetical protein